MAALRIARHEWGLILKEPRFLLPFLITPLLLVGVQGWALIMRPVDSTWETLLLARSLLLMLAVLSSSLAVPLGADSFAGERERNTFEILLCLPVAVRTLFWGKVMGVYPLPVFVGWMGQAAILILLGTHGLLLPEFLPFAVKAFVFTPALALFFCALAALISLGAETVRGAAQLTSLFMLAVFFSIMLISGRIFASPAWYYGALAALLAGAALCLQLARRRFLKLA
jgi:ABC-type Na+ efflux pump permease subunit